MRALLAGLALAVLRPDAVAAQALQQLAPWYFVNLLQNSSAEEGVGSPDIRHVVKPSDWATSGNFTVVQYGDSSGLPKPGNSKHPFGRDTLGKNFFAGGPSSDDSRAWQKVDLTRGGNDIDRAAARGRPIRFIATAYLGGRLAAPSYGRVYVRFFRDIANETTTRLCGGERQPCYVLGPVSRIRRDSISMLVEQRCWGDVPAGARWAKISMIATRVSGSDNVAFFDNLSFTLITPETPLKAINDIEVPACWTDPERAVAAAGYLDPDNRTRSCRWASFLGLMLVVAFIVGSLLLAFVKTSLSWRVRGALALSGALAGAAGVFTLVYFENVFHFADTGCIAEQPWAQSTLLCAVQIGFTVSTISYVFLRDVNSVWRRHLSILIVDIFLASTLAALGGIALFSVQGDELDSINAELVFLFICMWIVIVGIHVEKRRIPGWMKLMIFVFPLVPAYLAWDAFDNMRHIKVDRLADEERRSLYDPVPIHRNPGDVRLHDVLFFTPDSMRKDESRQVVFAANMDPPPGAVGCVVPEIQAYGFAPPKASAAPVTIAHRGLHWAWTLTAQHTGRQSIYVNVMPSRECPRNGKSTDTGQPIFTEREDVWVSRQAFSINDVAGALPWLGVVGTTAAVFIDLISLRMLHVPQTSPSPSPQPESETRNQRQPGPQQRQTPEVSKGSPRRKKRRRRM